MRSIRGDLRTGASADAELVVAARSGSMQAREALYRRHVNLVHGMAFRLSGRLADHRVVVDEIFTQLFSRLERLANPEALRPWLAGKIVSIVRRITRRQRLRTRLGLPVPASPLFEAMLAQVSPGTADEMTGLYREVDRLPLKLRMAFLLHRIEGMGMPDTALALGASVARVRRWVARAETRLGIAPLDSTPAGHKATA